jgi:hypothetical protein
MTKKIFHPEEGPASDGAMHPFKNCVSDSHAVIDCEEPNNDGHHENKGCGSGGGGGKSRFNQGLDANIAKMVTGWEAAAASNASSTGSESDRSSDDLAAKMEADIEDLVAATENEDIEEEDVGADLET